MVDNKEAQKGEPAQEEAKPSKPLTRAFLKEKQQEKVVERQVELDGELFDCRFAVLTAKQAGDFQSRFLTSDERARAKAAGSMKYGYLALCLRDENGGALSEQELGQLPTKVVEKLFEAASEVNPFGEKAAEDEAKN